MSTGFEFEIDDVAEGLALLESELEANVRAALVVGQNLVAARARELCPQGPTSLLRNSIQPLPLTGNFLGGSLEAPVEAGAPYALPVEEGSRPHVIEPRHRRALRWPVEGGFRFARRVHHPGTAAQPFMEPALRAVEDDVTAELEAAVELSLVRAGF